jgi:hypothetical protein
MSKTRQITGAPACNTASKVEKSVEVEVRSSTCRIFAQMLVESFADSSDVMRQFIEAVVQDCKSK